MALARISTELAIDFNKVSAIKKRANGLSSILVEGQWMDAEISFETVIEAHNQEGNKGMLVRSTDELAS